MHQQQIDHERRRIHNQRENQNVLIIARFVDNQIGNLITRQACDPPSGKRDTVNRRNLTHSVQVWQKGGQVTKSAAVAKVDKNQQRDTNSGNFIRDSARKQRKRRNRKFADENDFIDGISIF